MVTVSYFGYPRYLVTLSGASNGAVEAVEAITAWDKLPWREPRVTVSQ